MAARTFWVEPAAELHGGPLVAFVEACLQARFETIVLSAAQRAATPALPTVRPLSRDGDSYRLGAQEVGRHVLLEGTQGQAAALQALGSTAHLVVEATDWTVIPLENLIAAAQARPGTTLLAVVRDAKGADVALRSLERGTDGVVLRTPDVGQVRALAALRDAVCPTLALTPAVVEGVRPVGLGDRVCVDTCSLLRPGEGLLVGSQGSALFLVHGETVESAYVATRPFRVNAGPVHAYALMPDGTTRYLSELRAGDEVLLVDAAGGSRTAVIGRLKNEQRPLVQVTATAGDRRLHTMVQNAETIRFVCATGAGAFEPRSVLSLRPGDRLLVHLASGGRHFGMPVQETISE